MGALPRKYISERLMHMENISHPMVLTLAGITMLWACFDKTDRETGSLG
jgi:hypothetical protein